MKHKNIVSLILAAIIMIIFISVGCSPKKDESGAAKENKDIKRVESNDEMIRGHENDVMYMVSKTDFTLNGAPATVELYADLEPPVGGNPPVHYQDGEIWSLLVRQGEYVYQIISKKWVQIGHMNYYLWTDENDSSVYIVVNVIQGAGMNIYEYKYDAINEVFTVNEIYKTHGNGYVYNSSKIN